MRVPIYREPDARDLPLPAYATAGASGMDLHAAVREDVAIPPGGRCVIPTGIRISVPDGFEAQVRGRSGLASRHGLGLVNAPGTIDSDYTGEIRVILVNWGDAPVTIQRGDRIAQLVFAPVVQAQWSDLGDSRLGPTSRGDGGFGHTGLRPPGEDERGSNA
jgi:dUTP pyrophosphatase